MQWLVQLIGYIPRSPESSSLLQFPVDEHSQNQSFRELLSSSVQADNELITVPAPAADSSSVHRQAAHHQLITSLPSLYPFNSAKPCTASPSLGQELPPKKKGKQTLSKPEYKSPVMKQWHRNGGEADLGCWAWLCHIRDRIAVDFYASTAEQEELQLPHLWGFSKWTAIAEIAK